MAMMKQDVGELCVQAKLISPEQLQEAREVQKGTGQDIGDVLVEQGRINATQLLQARARVHGLRAVDVGAAPIDSGAINVVPVHVARRHCVIPLVKQGDGLVVAVTDPTNVLALDELKSSSGLKIQMVLGSKEAIEAAIEKH